MKKTSIAITASTLAIALGMSVLTGATAQETFFVAPTGKVGVGTATPNQKFHVFENLNVSTEALVQNPNGTGTSASAGFKARADFADISLVAHGAARLNHFGNNEGGWSELVVTSGNGLLIGTLTDLPMILGTNNTARMIFGGYVGVSVAGDFRVDGNFTVSGGSKNFAVVDPADSRHAIYYAALEGPEAGTYFRGTAETSGGEAVIELPGHFARVTEVERMTVQLTPIGSWGQLYVAEKTPGRLVVRTAPGTADLEFDYWVQGVRKGYLDFQVERPNDLSQH
jgi:hypothetical protein